MAGLVTTTPATATVISHADPGEVLPGLFVNSIFVNSYCIDTSCGIVIIDPGFGHASYNLRKRVRDWRQQPLYAAIYTHGHADHAFGLAAFLDAGEKPIILSQENLPARFRRYELTHGLNARINQRQFSLPVPMFPDRFDFPTLTFREQHTLQAGELQFELFAAKGETDDHCYIWVPQKRWLFAGDLIIWAAPNCGNPQKVQRYPIEWADALDKMAALNAEWLFPGHGLIVHGAAAVREVLTNTAKYLRHIATQVIARMNEGQTPEQIFHEVEPDAELAKLPYLRATYDHPKFIVRNLLRLYGGWWNGTPSELLPAHPNELSCEVVKAAGGLPSVLNLIKSHLTAGNTKLAAHFIDLASRAVSSAQLHPAATTEQARQCHSLKRDVYQQRLREEESLMACGIYRAAANDARALLGEEVLPAPVRMSLSGREQTASVLSKL